MVSARWSWELTPLGWWAGQRADFNGKIAVFERLGTWCARVEILTDGTPDLAHFSEGHSNETVAKITAEKSAERAMRLRQSHPGVVSV